MLKEEFVFREILLSAPPAKHRCDCISVEQTRLTIAVRENLACGLIRSWCPSREREGLPELGHGLEDGVRCLRKKTFALNWLQLQNGDKSWGTKGSCHSDKLGGGSLQHVNYIETAHLSVSNVLKESLFVHLIIFQVPQSEADAT